MHTVFVKGKDPFLIRLDAFQDSDAANPLLTLPTWINPIGIGQIVWHPATSYRPYVHTHITFTIGNSAAVLGVRVRQTPDQIFELIEGRVPSEVFVPPSGYAEKDGRLIQELDAAKCVLKT
jgi:hypothetical protein